MTHQESQSKEPVKIQKTSPAPDMPTPFPLPNPLGILPVEFVYPVPMTASTVMPQVVPQALLKNSSGVAAAYCFQHLNPLNMIHLTCGMPIKKNN